ncbi:MAG: hypothetical protein CM15mP116_00510 [Synechococcus sp.]|nr:MAG: hypothetical protein CM15mP116_00510 [Synechococcus sp.]
MVEKLFGTVTGKRLAILGFAFKADTNDTREAPAIRICRNLLEEGAQLAIHDPKVAAQQIARDLQQEQAPKAEALSGTGSWLESCSVEDAVIGADAVLVLTEWKEYRTLNWMALAALMRKPAWAFDARAITDHAQVRAAGLTLWCVGMERVDGADGTCHWRSRFHWRSVVDGLLQRGIVWSVSTT